MGYEKGLGFDDAVKNCPGGYEIVISDDHTLQIDYDHSTLPDNFDNMVNMFRQRIGNLIWYSFPSKSGNTHVTIKFDIPMTIHERIAWQAAFGSDPKREILGLIRVAMGNTNPILFFEKKGLVPEPIKIAEDGRVFRNED